VILSAISTSIVRYEFTIAYVSILGLLAIFGYYKYRSNLSLVSAGVGKSLSRLPGPDPIEFTRSFAEFDSWMKKESALSHLWSEYSETLLLPSPFDVEPRICNTAESACCFNESSILSGRVNLRLYNALPNILTGLGILGTFIGLVAGIYLASQGLASGNEDELKQALQRLLSGASLAFWTSIGGLLFSILFSLAEKSQAHKLQKLISKWNTELDKRIIRCTPESIARDQLRSLQKQTDHLETFVNSVATNVADALDQRMNAKLVPALERVANAVEGLRADRGESNDQLLREMVASFKETMTGAAGTEMAALGATLESLNSTLRPLLEEVSQAQESMRDTAQNIALQISGSYEQSSRDFSEKVMGALDQLKESIAHAGASLNGDLEAAFTRSHAAQEAMQQAMARMADQMRTSQEEASGRLNAGVQEAMQRLASAVQDAGASLNLDLTQSFGGAADRFQASTSALDTVVGNARNLAESSGKIIEKVSEVLSGFNDVTSAVRTAQEKAGLTIGQLENAANTLANSGRQVETAMAEVRKSIEQLQATARQYGDVQNTMHAAWTNYADRFENVDQSLAKVMENLHRGLQGFAENIRKYVADLDSHAAKITDNLSGAVQEFGNSIEELAHAQSGNGRRAN